MASNRCWSCHLTLFSLHCYHKIFSLPHAAPPSQICFQPLASETHLDLSPARFDGETWRFPRSWRSRLHWTLKWNLEKPQSESRVTNRAATFLPSPERMYCSLIAENSSCPAVSKIIVTISWTAIKTQPHCLPRISSFAGMSSITTCCK